MKTIFARVLPKVLTNQITRFMQTLYNTKHHKFQMITRRFKEVFSVMMKALNTRLLKNKFPMDYVFSFGASLVLFQSPLLKFSIIRSMLPVLPTQINFSIPCPGSLLSSTEFQELVSQEECLPTQQQNWQNTKQEGKKFHS